MKKRIIYGLALAGIAGVIFLSGCSKIEPQSEGVPIRISAGLSMYTRATDTSFEQGDALGLYLVKWGSGTPGSLQSTGNYGDNLPFSLTSSGWQTSATAQYPQDGEKLDFYAYYPYVSSSALDGEGYRVHRTATDQRQESAYKGSDLLMASASGVSAGTAAVHLQFSHMLSKMEIELKAGEGLTLEELTEATITIKGVKTSGKVHLSSKACQTDETKEDVIAHGTFSLAAGGEKLTGVSAIVYPQEIASGAELIEIGLGEEKYLFTTTKPITLQAGYKSIFTITLSRNSLSVETGVTDWTEGEGDEGVAQPGITIPDEVFRSYIVELLKTEGIKSPEWDGGTIHRQDVEKITRIDIPAPGSTEPKIKTLAGIEYFAALEYLSFPSQEVSAVDVSKNIKLDTLICWNNQLTALDVSQNTALKYLQCNVNPLTALDVSQNTALTVLSCGGNQLTTLDVGQNTTLAQLYCGGNQLTSLDVSQNTALDTLACHNNQLTALDVSRNTALKWLVCGSNPLTSLDVSQNTALTVLSCSGNQLTSLDVSQNTALTYLFCVNNQLTSLDVSQNTALTELSCTNNQLTSLDVSGCTALTRLECWNNQLTSLDVSQNTALTTLSCYDNQLTSLDVGQNTLLTYLGCWNNQLTSLDISKNTVLTRLLCWNNQLTSLDVSQNTALMHLLCSDNQLTTLDVGQNTALAQLSCSDNQLTSLDISKNTALISLGCWNNQLTSLDVSQNTALMHLQCSDNQLTSLDISKNTELNLFTCYNNPGDGAVFPVTAWFGNDAIPSYFTSSGWTYGENTISIDYRPVE